MGEQHWCIGGRGGGGMGLVRRGGREVRVGWEGVRAMSHSEQLTASTKINYPQK